MQASIHGIKLAPTQVRFGRYAAFCKASTKTLEIESYSGVPAAEKLDFMKDEKDIRGYDKACAAPLNVINKLRSIHVIYDASHRVGRFDVPILLLLGNSSYCWYVFFRYNFGCT